MNIQRKCFYATDLKSLSTVFRVKMVKYLTRFAVLFYSYPRRGTKCGRALTYTRRYLFGGSGKRKKVLIVMTDGKSYDNVQPPAKALKGMGVKIFALGMGKKYNKNQLLQMSSGASYVYTSGFRSMGKVVKKLKQKACKTIGKMGKTTIEVIDLYVGVGSNW